MKQNELPTKFLPAARTSKADLEKSKGLFATTPLLRAILDGVPVVVLMLDQNRQIVLANSAVLSILHLKDVDSVFGL